MDRLDVLKKTKPKVKSHKKGLLLTEEEKRERVREALLKKKSFEDRAIGLVTELLEPGLTAEWLRGVAPWLTQQYYSDGVEERTLARLCGYPLCDKEHDPNNVKGKFHISMRTNKVYNIEERKLFCSAVCFKSSSFLRDQLETSPLWLREGDTPPAPVRLYGEEEEGEGAMDWSGGGQVQLEKPPAVQQTARVVRVEADPAQQAVGVLKSWFTVDSFRLVQGEERLREELRRNRVEREAWAPSLGDPALEEQYQARYRDLARRLDMLDIREEQGEQQQERLPMPSFEMLRHDMETENQKLSSFLAGRSSYEDAGGVKEAAVEEGLEPRLPPVDHQAQLQLRRGIVLERLAHSLPAVLQPLGLSLQGVREGVRELVSSFQLLATTVTLAPPAWRLTGLLLLHLLAVRDLELAAVLQQRAEVLAAMLAELGLLPDFPDGLVRELTSDVMPLLAKYNIKYT